MRLVVRHGFGQRGREDLLLLPVIVLLDPLHVSSRVAETDGSDERLVRVLLLFLRCLGLAAAAAAAAQQGLEGLLRRDAGAPGIERARLLERGVRVHLAPAVARPALQRRHGVPAAVPPPLLLLLFLLARRRGVGVGVNQEVPPRGGGAGLERVARVPGVRLERNLGGAARALDVEAEDPDRAQVPLAGDVLHAGVELGATAEVLPAGAAADGHREHRAHLGLLVHVPPPPRDLGRVEVVRVVLV